MNYIKKFDMFSDISEPKYDLKEHDVVISTTQIGDIVDKHTQGVIVYIYKNGYFEVEFDVNGSSVVEKVKRDQIEIKN